MHYYNELRPPGHVLAVLLRAAMADARDGGPWLSIGRSHDGAVLVHHLNISSRTPISPSRLLLLSGDDALSYALMHGWTTADVLDPSARHLRALGGHAMLRHDAAGWLRDFPTWHAWWLSPEFRAEQHAAAGRAARAARQLRRDHAEQCLSRA